MKNFIYFLSVFVLFVIVVSYLPETGVSKQEADKLKTEITSLKLQLQNCSGRTYELEKLAK